MVRCLAVTAIFGRHRDAEIYASRPGLGVMLGARAEAIRAEQAIELGLRLLARTVRNAI
jgi:hypothetical protein